MLEEAAAQLRPKAEEKGVSLLYAPTDADAVFGGKWTEEAVCNLLDNAVKYTPPGGRVALRTVSYELFSRVDVADTGPGIPEEEHAEILGLLTKSNFGKLGRFFRPVYDGLFKITAVY